MSWYGIKPIQSLSQWIRLNHQSGCLGVTWPFNPCPQLVTVRLTLPQIVRVPFNPCVTDQHHIYLQIPPEERLHIHSIITHLRNEHLETLRIASNITMVAAYLFEQRPITHFFLDNSGNDFSPRDLRNLLSHSMCHTAPDTKPIPVPAYNGVILLAGVFPLQTWLNDEKSELDWSTIRSRFTEFALSQDMVPIQIPFPFPAI